MARPPAEELAAGVAFYARIAPDLDVSHFAAMWHIFTAGHMVATDLDRVARGYGLSIADLHVLGTLRIERPERLRATDLALTLHVSNAALSARIAKLQKRGYLLRVPSPADRRAFELQLTPVGAALAEAAIADIGRNAAFIRYYRRLGDADRAALGRIMGELHNLLDRDFVPAKRGDG